MTNKIKGKNAVVLGASAEGGSGFAIAKALTEAGCNVIIAARRKKELQSAAQKIGAKSFICDAVEENQISDLAAFAKDNVGKIDIAVNAAGAPMRGPIAEVTRSQLQDTLDLNYISHVFLSNIWPKQSKMMVR